MTIGTFYNPFSDPQDRPPVTHCHRCGTEIYREDKCFMHNALILCENCGDPQWDCEETGYSIEQYYKELYGGHYE